APSRRPVPRGGTCRATASRPCAPPPRRRSVVPAPAEPQTRLALASAGLLGSPHGPHRARPVGPALAFARAIRKGAFVALNERILPPSPVLLALEGRAWLEFAALVPALPLLARAPRGDGHPVLVLPGWLATHPSTWARRHLLRDRGPRVRRPRTPLDAPLPVPSSSLYSRSDGVVAWRSCLQDEGPLAENIEVRSSHCGMGHHPGALLVIADRLAQPEGAWRPYTPPALPWRAALGLAG